MLFPGISIRPKKSCRDVQRAVIGLRAVPSLHATEPYGLVDNDSLPPEEIGKLQTEHIYALPIFSVESLYYCREMRAALADRQAANLGLEAAALLDKAEKAALAALSSARTQSHLAARVSERHMRDLLLNQMPTRAELVEKPATQISLNIASPYPEELARIGGLVAGRHLDDVINRYPVRESGALDAIAKALRFIGRADYERAALVQVETRFDLAEMLRAKLGALATMLC